MAKVQVGEFVMYQPKPNDDVPSPARLVSTDIPLKYPMVFEPALALVVALDDDDNPDLCVFYSPTRTPAAWGHFGPTTTVQHAKEGREAGQYQRMKA